MKKNKYLLFAIMILFLNISYVNAECSDEELNQIIKEIDKIEITYKHLGEVTKEDGSKVYNQFLVTAKNIPENVYVHLSPMTEENFDETTEDLKIKLTTGTWYYNMYSSKCETVVDTITVKLPTFNIYSLDPLCEGVDGEDFKYCGKYYEYQIDRETFERKVKAYRIEHKIGQEDTTKVEKENNFFQKILDILKDNYLYILGVLGVLLLTILTIIIISKKKKRKILQ
ncbi:MAG: hypothetical protein ACI4VL_04710 [Bacilli bacterium]